MGRERAKRRARNARHYRSSYRSSKGIGSHPGPKSTFAGIRRGLTDRNITSPAGETLIFQPRASSRAQSQVSGDEAPWP